MRRSGDRKHLYSFHVVDKDGISHEVAEEVFVEFEGRHDYTIIHHALDMGEVVYIQYIIMKPSHHMPVPEVCP